MSNALSQAALETLSIIAYKQPISRIEIDEIRGVQTSGSIQKLVARQLIEENTASMVLVERFCMAQRSILWITLG